MTSRASLVLQKPHHGDQVVEVLNDLLQQIENSENTESSDPEILFKNSHRLLISIAQKRYGFSRDDAEELAQEAWCLFLEKKESVRTPRTWLTGTVVNLCKHEIRRRCRDRDEAEEVPEPTEDGKERLDTVLAVREAFDHLDERSRNLCRLIAIEEHSYNEVSSMLRLPLGSVGPLYMRAKTNFRAVMAGAA